MRKQTTTTIRSLACGMGAGMMLAMSVASPALAADQVKSTTVTAIADPNGTIAFEVPTEIPFYVASDGTLASSSNALKIVNKSVFGINVTKVQVSANAPFALAADVTKANNSLDFIVGPNGDPIKASGATAGTATKQDLWHMDYSGSDKDSVAITASGKMGKTTAPLESKQTVASVTFSVAPGSLNG